MLQLITEHASATGARDDVAYFRGPWLGLDFVGWDPAAHAEPQEIFREDAYQRIREC